MIDSVSLVAAALVLSLTFYALLGGADYGGGVWDLAATGRTADRQRATIARAIGPVWEANHVWLIVAIVILFTAFPSAFAQITTFLHVPLLLVLIGIVLRGAAFVFRAYGSNDPRQERLWGRVFAVASTTTPVFLGVTLGAISDGRLPTTADGSFYAVFMRPWLAPFPLAVGVFALALFSQLAAVYLTLETAHPQERAAFRARALGMGVAAAALACAVLLLAGANVRNEITGSAWSLPLLLAAGASSVATFGFLWAERFRLARIAVAAQVTLVLWGWAFAHYPFAIYPHLTLADAAAPETVRLVLLQTLGLGGLLLFPALLYLFRIFGPRGQENGNTGKGAGPRGEGA